MNTATSPATTIAVYKAINRVQADLAKSGIGKDSENKFDGYKFRGIDAVYNALSPLLAKHELCVLPRMLSRTVDERQSQKGGALFYVTVEAEFDFVSAQDGSKHTVRTFGEAMDRGDKATNKAMSAAYKYAAFQAFAIPTEGDNDADASTHEVQAKDRLTEQLEASIEQTRKVGALQSAAAEAAAGMDQPTLQGLYKLADRVIASFKSGGSTVAFALLEDQGLNADEKTVVWGRLDSKVRSGLKHEGQVRSLKTAAEVA